MYVCMYVYWTDNKMSWLSWECTSGFECKLFRRLLRMDTLGISMQTVDIVWFLAKNLFCQIFALNMSFKQLLCILSTNWIRHWILRCIKTYKAHFVQVFTMFNKRDNVAYINTFNSPSVAAILDFSILNSYWPFLSWAHSRFGFSTLL